ncbi:MAG: hypothetical protein KAR62_08030 [Sphingomonadales bacterium]|nr:hypothetical protein [Sphingomonadales bacterium]
MQQPTRYLSRMTMFAVIVVFIGFMLIEPLQSAFYANAGLNGVILATLLFGCFFIFRQVISLKSEINWVERYKNETLDEDDAPSPKLLAPMAALLVERQTSTKLSSHSMGSLLDSLSARLDEGREISRYLIGLLVFLGLLGTFWGLLGTIGSISTTIESLSVGSGDINTMFADLKSGLNAPLSGMATAFSSSLLGLAGSVMLGFLDLQAGQAQNRFYNDLEEWLSSQTKLSSAAAIEGAGDGGGSTSAYVGALLEQTADSLEKLERVISKSEDGRKKTNATLLSLAEQQALLGDQLKASQELMVRLAEGQGSMGNAMKALADSASKSASGGMDEQTKSHLRNIDVHIKQLLDQQAEGNAALTDGLRSEIKLLARTLSSAMTNQDNS